jgi:putative component of membrane protein insertase Oxa1/YidC/SpoIIIJ protein YidD
MGYLQVIQNTCKFQHSCAEYQGLFEKHNFFSHLILQSLKKQNGADEFETTAAAQQECRNGQSINFLSGRTTTETGAEGNS